MYDDDQVVYSHDFVETDANGNVAVRFQMPYRLLKPGHSEDGLIIRLTHGDVAYTRAFTLVKGLNIIVPQELKEGELFNYEVQNSAGETLIEAGINYDAGPSHRFPNRETDGSGNARPEERMPYLIQSNADRDGAEFWVKTKDVTWYFPFTIVRGEKQSTANANVGRINGVGGGTLYPVQASPSTHPGLKTLFGDPRKVSLRMNGAALDKLIRKPTFNYVTRESEVTETNMHQFHADYSGIISSALPGSVQIRNVIANVWHPPALGETVCTRTEVVSNGSVVASGERKCRVVSFLSPVSRLHAITAFTVPENSIGPIVEAHNSEIRVHIEYAYTGPFGESTDAAGHDFGDKLSFWGKILISDPCIPGLYDNIYCDLPKSDEVLFGKLSGEVIVVLPLAQ